MRPAPTLTPPKVEATRRPETLTQQYVVLTPVFGGGVEPQTTDPDEPARVPGIRGQLRFWWRATRGAAFQSVEALREAEDAIWGSSKQPSAVEVRVEATNRGRQTALAVHAYRDADSCAPPYAGFPAAGKPLWEGVEFSLTLRFKPEHKADVEAALWAFGCFGGIGGRTRRGFGAVQEKASIVLTRDQWVAAIAEGFKRHVVAGAAPGGCPSLDGVHTDDVKARWWGLGLASRDANMAWRKAINVYKGYRQSRRSGSQPNRPGRSFWPEPDEIRRLSGQRNKIHADLTKVSRFPRAVFGLPIIFHYQGGGDPVDHTLKGTGNVERLASPLILRPVRCKDGALPLALVLRNSFASPDGLVPGGLMLTSPGGKAYDVQHKLEPAHLKEVDTAVKNADVLLDFLDYFYGETT